MAAGDRIHFGHDRNSCFLGQLDATVIEKHEGGEVLLGFDLSGPFLDEALHAVGHMPLPPYIASKRPDDERDRTDYQTIYAREEGAVAGADRRACISRRSFFAALDARGVERHFVTLHVGAGRFCRSRPTTRPTTRCTPRPGHVSPATAAAINAAKARGNRVVCVGTTSLRLLESAAARTDALPPHGRARPTSSSRRATASAPPTR